jgi:uncharacterized protein YuzE
MGMRLAHDLDADALYITLTDTKIVRTVEIDEGTMVDVDAVGRVVGIEVISPQRIWPLQEILRRFKLDDADATLLRATFEPATSVQQGAPSPVLATA